MDQKYRKYYLDWWKIRKSTISKLVAFSLAALIIGVGGWPAVRNNWFQPQDTSPLPNDEARIISFEGDVRITRAATRETILVTKQTHVAAGDTIQTQADGKAVVQMIDGSVYSVRPNSTVVIRDNSSIFGGRNVRVALDDGQLNVRTDQQADSTENVVEMLDSETQLRPQTDASFNTDSQAMNGEIRISRGSVETTVGGTKTTIGENEFAAVSNGKLSAKEQLLAPPKQASPANISQIVDTGGSGASVAFIWQGSGAGGVSGYHLQVSRSPFFASDSILVDRASLTSPNFRLAGLVPGSYYWRLKSTVQSGQSSDWSEPWKFNIVKREPSTAFDVTDWSVERVGGNIFMITGRTQRGLRVRSQGRETFAAADGAFRLQISTPLSEAAVELVDDKGNRAGLVLSLTSSTVLRRF